MPRLKNPGPGPVSLASGRVLDVGEHFSSSKTDVEDQRHIDAGRLVVLPESAARKRGTNSTEEEEG